MILRNRLSGEVIRGVPHDLAVRYAVFPHFKPQETEVMKAFIRSGMLRGIWYFDVPLETTRSLELRRAVDRLLRLEAKLFVYRIDSICETEDAYWVLEVKERLRKSGVGEIVTYRMMFEDQYEPKKIVRSGYVYRAEDIDMWSVLNAHGIVRFRV